MVHRKGSILWGAVCKNIISDRCSTKTAMTPATLTRVATSGAFMSACQEALHGCCNLLQSNGIRELQFTKLITHHMPYWKDFHVFQRWFCKVEKCAGARHPKMYKFRSFNPW